MSVKTAGGSLTSRPGELARAGVNDIFAGLIASVITIAFGLSFAALIFAPPLNTWLAYGIAATFITSAVTWPVRVAASPAEVSKDTIIAEQGDPARSMHFILEGRIGIIVKMDDGRLIRVRSLGPHTTIGEMGLITRQKRSATIRSEVPSVLYELNADAYERLKRENGALAQALLTYIVQVMAERLSFASKVIGVLRR